jgi:hypothetical protein
MANQVYANGREIACKAASGQTIPCFPDVCLSPPSPPAGPIPIPYPNLAFASDTTKGSKTVQISDQEVMLKDSSTFKKSTGDEAATKSLGMGVITHQITGEVSFSSYSMDVKFEGENVDRHLDMTLHNEQCQPAQGPGTYADSMAVGAPGSKNDPCKHKNNRKKRKYIIYIAQDLDNPGKIYVGRTQGPPNATNEAILRKRKSTHHRNLGPLQAVCETTSYAAIRGAEQLHKQDMAKRGLGTKQDNPIDPRKKKKREKYVACAKQKNTTCSICGSET